MLNTFLLSLQLASVSLKEKESGKALLQKKRNQSQPPTAFWKISVLVVIKHVHSRQLILSTGEVLFIHLQHKITRKIMLVINPHGLNAIWAFWECCGYLLSYHCNPSPPTSSPDTLPTMLLWCTYQHISPLIFFIWMWTVPWCLTESAWARSPVFREGAIFLLLIAYQWVSVLPWKEVFQHWGCQLCVYGKCLCEPILLTCGADQVLCVAIFIWLGAQKKYILPLHRVYLLRHDAMLHRHVAFGLLWVLSEQVGVCLQYAV